MTEVKKLNVGGMPIGIRDLDEVIAGMADEFKDRSDQEVGEEMLARLERVNYIADVAREEYAEAFIRAFRKHLGQPYRPATRQGLEVKVLGPGCPNCHALYDRAAKVLARLGLAADLEAVQDVAEIAASGVMSTPGLMINGKVVSVGKVPSESQLEQWFKRADH
jgi:small redox-active disulfide protein 2